MKIYKYRLYADGRIVFEDDFDRDNQELDLGASDDFKEYEIPDEIFDYIVDGYSEMRRYINGLPNCPVCHSVAEWDKDEFGDMIRCMNCGINTGGEYSEADSYPNVNEANSNHFKIWRGK